jgi:predicted TPR repeat methyltransferase
MLAAPPTPPLRHALECAVDLLRTEQLDAADAALDEILRAVPEQPDALHFQGILRHAQGRSDEGIALIRRALARMPAEAGAWNNLGNVLVESQRLDEAVEAYRMGVTVADGRPASAEPLNNLGTLQRLRLDWPAAERSCRAALKARPDFVDAWYNLSLALLGQGRVAEGLQANSQAVTLAPRHLQPRDQVIRALLLQGEREQAAALYREWLAEEPHNPVVQHQLAACLGNTAPARASDAYVEQVFDSFARSFDVKLEKLHYRAPELVADALRRALGEARAALDIVDAGCGTGLCGAALKPWARRLAGCDLSVGMLRQARARAVYDVLHKAELVHYLDTQAAGFDVVVSADTLCYFGDLEDVAAAACKALKPDGRLIFTVEALADDAQAAHRLQVNGRYAHRRDYLVRTLGLAGFEAPEIEAVELRMEAGVPVRGWLVSVARR